jgi:ankyrin repeat protein
MMAANKGNMDIMNTLLNSKAIVDKKDKKNKTALFYAVDSEFGENVDIVSALIENKSSLNLEIENGYTLIIKAVEKNYCQIVKLLLESFINN